MIIEAGLTRYEAVNKEIEKQLEKQNKVTVKDVNGQRYIGCALDEGKTIEVYGTPGTTTARPPCWTISATPTWRRARPAASPSTSAPIR